MAIWPGLMMGAFAEGVTRALAGERGTPQDHEHASYAAPFTEAERWLDPHESIHVLQRKATALNLLGAPTAKLRLGEQAYLVTRLDPIANAPTATPGSVLNRTDDGFALAVADGAVQVKATVLA